MRITIQRAQDVATFADYVGLYRSSGWTVAPSPTGFSLVTGAVCGVEMAGDPVADVLRLMHRTGLSWPTLDVPGSRRLVILAAGSGSRDELRRVLTARAIPRHGGALVPLPPTMLVGGPVRWVIPPRAGERLPGVDAVVSAIRQATDWRYTAAPRAAS